MPTDHRRMPVSRRLATLMLLLPPLGACRKDAARDNAARDNAARDNAGRDNAARDNAAPSSAAPHPAVPVGPPGQPSGTSTDSLPPPQPTPAAATEAIPLPILLPTWGDVQSQRPPSATSPEVAILELSTDHERCAKLWLDPRTLTPQQRAQHGVVLAQGQTGSGTPVQCPADLLAALLAKPTD